MKLRTLTVENFRQFYGRHTLHFASSEERNTTVVFGANGAGKTTLLNAFTWVLYEMSTPAFENPTHLVNERAWAEADMGKEVCARVILEFEHENRIYTVERVRAERKAPNGERQLMKDAELSVEHRDEDGRHYRERENPNDVINQILPERLHRFFFFDGERIEHLVKPAAYGEIAEAIKNVLGLEVIERAVRHLGTTTRKLEGELKAVGTPEMRRIQEELDDERKRLDGKKTELAKVEENRAALQEEMEAIDNRLRTLEEARRLQEKRDALEAQYESNQHAIKNIRSQLARISNQRGYLAFTKAMAASVVASLQNRRERGEIPSPIKRQFVEDLLDRGECICGSPLHAGTEQYARVRTWRDRAGLSDVEESWTKLSAHAEDFIRSRSELYRDIRAHREELARYRAAQTALEEQISEISLLLGRMESEEVRGLEARRDSLKNQVGDCQRRAWTLEHEIQELNDRIRAKERELLAAKAEGQRAEVALRRVRVASEARELFQRILELRTGEVRRQLDERVKRIYSRISYKAYVPALSPDFRLELTKSVGGEDEMVAKGTGENQILSLSFVGAIADLARERYREAAMQPSRATQTLSFHGGIYPIVMDSPFGSLDENYRTQVAQAIPVLAPQVVVFVTKSQGLGAVQLELTPRTGRRYVIRYYTPKSDAVRETIELGSRQHPYIEPTTEPYEWAVIEEV